MPASPRRDECNRGRSHPLTYDRLDWHLDSALEAGQPAENAFTHIGLYLAWLIHHDLHDPAMGALKRLGVPPADAWAVNGICGLGEETLVVILFAVPGIDGSRLQTESPM